jgi:hypothetical protein
MRKPHCALVLFLLLAFGLSLAVPAEDVPETPYDESEALPYEGTPVFSIVAPQASGRIAKAERNCGSPLRFNSSTRRCQHRCESSSQLHRVPDSLTILDHAFRC